MSWNLRASGTRTGSSAKASRVAAIARSSSVILVTTVLASAAGGASPVNRYIVRELAGSRSGMSLVILCKVLPATFAILC